MPLSSKDALRTRLLAIFREEASDHLRAIQAEMELMERAAGQPEALRAILDRLFRIVHTLKGAARSLSVRSVEHLCHEMEDLCSAGRHGDGLDADDLALLRDLAGQLADATEEAIARRPPPPPAPSMEPPAAPASAAPAKVPEQSTPPAPVTPPRQPAAAAYSAPRAPDAPVRTGKPAAPAVRAEIPAFVGPPAAPVSFVRLETTHLQRLGLKAEELTTSRLASRARLDQMREIIASFEALRGESRLQADAPLAKRFREVEQLVRQLLTGLSEDSRVLHTITEGLVEELRRTRMMHVSEMLGVFPAMVADLAGEVGKEIHWHTSGTDLLIDREVADLLKDPLIHIVRNAVDHGIEPPAERQQAGKPPRGTISLAVEPAEGGRVAIDLSDDGGGIDVVALREAVIRNRLASREQADALPDAAIIEMAFEPSVSIRSVISAVSGRGLGLAIVRERLERLGGTVFISSSRGSGTTIRMEVPAALANFHGIGVESGGSLVIWPRTAVERTVTLSDATFEAALARGAVQIDDQVLPFAELGALLGHGSITAPAHERASRHALLVQHGQRRGLVAVEQVLGQCEAIVKELRPPLLRVRHVLATGLLGDGRLGLILRPADILDALYSDRRRPLPGARPAARTRTPRLLVVDDSITTRAMEVGLLEAAGYQVVAASDGLEAWSALQQGDFDAIISDIDMPNMDGFQLTEKVRSDQRLGHVPIVLVTALENREDHERGLRLGANAYMMKSAFDQSMLIDLVRRVL